MIDRDLWWLWCVACQRWEISEHPSVGTCTCGCPLTEHPDTPLSRRAREIREWLGAHQMLVLRVDAVLRQRQLDAVTRSEPRTPFELRVTWDRDGRPLAGLCSGPERTRAVRIPPWLESELVRCAEHVGELAGLTPQNRPGPPSGL